MIEHSSNTTNTHFILRQVMIASAVAISTLLWPSIGWADEIPAFAVSSVSSEDVALADHFDTSAGTGELLVGIDDCDAYLGGNLIVKVSFDQPEGESLYAVYASPAGKSCSDTLSAVKDSSNESCHQIESEQTLNDNNIEFTVPFDILLGFCDPAENQGTATISIYINEKAGTTAYDYISYIDLDLDLTEPVAPVIEDAQPGDGKIAVTWTDPDEAPSYILYWDDAEFDDTTLSYVTTYEKGITASSFEITENLVNGRVYYVGVQAIDDAGNVSALSTLAEAAPIETVDFWEAYLAVGGQDREAFCFVATAAYGSSLAGELDTLRIFRDEFLRRTALGTAFVDGYYRWGRFAATWIADKPALRAATRVLLAPLVWFATLAVWLGTIGSTILLLFGLTMGALTYRRWTRILHDASEEVCS